VICCDSQPICDGLAKKIADAIKLREGSCNNVSLRCYNHTLG
jgi:hypothetical protein